MQEYSRAKTVERRTIILKGIGNSGLELSHLVEEIINNENNDMETRFNAIFALRRNPETDDVTELLLTVFRNEKNMYDVELRIGSFSLLIDLFPTEQMLSTLVSYLNDETDKQLGNYIYSYLKNLVNMPIFMKTSEEL